MDKFNVPRKINRHVLKALKVMTTASKDIGVSCEEIIRQVRFQMRNLVPVEDLECTIIRSLNNLTSLGVLRSDDFFQYAINSVYNENNNAPDSDPIRNYFPPREEASKHDGFSCDPNRKRKRSSESSFSGDEIERIGKHTKRLKQKGRVVSIPKSRQHKKAKIESAESDDSCDSASTANSQSSEIELGYQEKADLISQLGELNANNEERLLSGEASTSTRAMSAVVVHSVHSQLGDSPSLQALDNKEQAMQTSQLNTLGKRDDEHCTVITEETHSRLWQGQSESGGACGDNNDDEQNVRPLVADRPNSPTLSEALRAEEDLNDSDIDEAIQAYFY